LHWLGGRDARLRPLRLDGTDADSGNGYPN